MLEIKNDKSNRNIVITIKVNYVVSELIYFVPTAANANTKLALTDLDRVAFCQSFDSIYSASAKSNFLGQWQLRYGDPSGSIYSSGSCSEISSSATKENGYYVCGSKVIYPSTGHYVLTFGIFPAQISSGDLYRVYNSSVKGYNIYVNVIQ